MDCRAGNSTHRLRENVDDLFGEGKTDQRSDDQRHQRYEQALAKLFNMVPKGHFLIFFDWHSYVKGFSACRVFLFFLGEV